MKNILLLLLLGLFSLVSCNLEKNVAIDLPDYYNEPVVECYLEPGKPFRLLLTRSFGYFDRLDFENPTAALINDATVVIRYGNKEIALINQFTIDPQSGQFSNYSHSDLVPFNHQDSFELDIVLADGNHLHATTRILPVVAIDSLVVQFNADSMARVLTYFTEDLQTTNFYRRILNFGRLDSTALQDFLVNDDFFETPIGAFGTGYNFEDGDTLIHTLVHIDKAYYDFSNTLNQSITANLNPFGQPGLIISNISGTRSAIGIFAGLSYVRDTSIITK